MPSTVQRGAEIFAAIMRITGLNADGSISPTNTVIATDYHVKVTPAKVMETGDEIGVKNAGGSLAAWYKHDDIPKWSTIAIELAIPDPNLIALLTGGTVFSSTADGLGAIVDGPTLAAFGSGSTLPADLLTYALTQGNAFGQTPLSPEETITPTAGQDILIELAGADDAADYYGVYGRSAGLTMGRLALVKNIGTQATSDVSGTGADIVTLPVEALTAPIPAGTKFIISGDTNTPQIVWTTTATAGEGATVIAVESDISVTTTIAAADLIQVFVDDGSALPGSRAPLSDMSAGPGTNLGYQDGPQGVVSGGPISIELWTENVIDGQQSLTQPWVWSAFPLVTGCHLTTRDFTNANLQTMIEGVIRQNPNWGAGPNNDFPVDSTRAFQDTVCGDEVVPEASYVLATALT